MSEVYRYNIKPGEDGYEIVVSLGGEWVHYADYANLKAEVERLKEGNDCLDKMHEKEMARSAYLCEEVNRTTAWGRGLESDLSHARVEISFLKAEVEQLKEDNRQLTKAFEIAEGIIKRMGKAAEDAAKEGKHP